MSTPTIQEQIQALQMQLMELGQQLCTLQEQAPAIEVPEYKFDTLEGEVSLLELFAGRETLFAIHNMGQGCRYCTLWADGLNPFLPHLEDQYAVVLLSKDAPETQRRLANERGWRFRMASHGGGDYIRQQSVMPEANNMPGMVVYQRDGERVLRKSATPFGPGDLYCSFWHVLALAGISADKVTPQFNYWQRPQQMEDGGENLR